MTANLLNESKRSRYISVGGWQTAHMNIVIRRGDKLRRYSAFDNDNDENRHWYSDAHQIVRARRMALAAMFFVELTA